MQINNLPILTSLTSYITAPKVQAAGTGFCGSNNSGIIENSNDTFRTGAQKYFSLSQDQIREMAISNPRIMELLNENKEVLAKYR